MLRSNGRAVVGAVDVLGGAENVRDPRDPELDPPPMRASAADATSATGIATERTTAKALMEARMRCENLIVQSFDPRQGESAPNMGKDAQKESTRATTGLRPSVAPWRTHLHERKDKKQNPARACDTMSVMSGNCSDRETGLDRRDKSLNRRLSL
jgi:hypothetical protein